MLHLIVNPVAGRGRGLDRLDHVVRTLEAAGAAVAVHHTSRPRHAIELVTALPEGSVPVAVGGDGTAHEVAIACLRRTLVMGVLPTGSGDDFAFGLGIDRHDLDAAVRFLLAGQARRVDVGLVDGAMFVNAFGSGFDADVARRIAHAPAAYRGLGRYLYGIVTAMRDFRVREVEVEVDGALAYAGPSLLVSVQNGPRAGGSFLFSPTARVDDGQLDVLVAGAFGRLGTFGILPRVMRGTHLTSPRIHFVRGRRVAVRWSEPMTGHVDGEVFEEPVARYDVSLQAGALSVLAPPRAT